VVEWPRSKRKEKLQARVELHADTLGREVEGQKGIGGPSAEGGFSQELEENPKRILNRLYAAKRQRLGEERTY